MHQEDLVNLQYQVIGELCTTLSWESMSDANVNGIAFEVFPWHGYCALSFRVGSERASSWPAEWKLHECARTRDCSAFGTVAAWYEGAHGGSEAQNRAHRIFCASGQVMLDSVGFFLPEELRERLKVPEGRFSRTLELMVFDRDRTFSFNYCEFLFACRKSRISHNGVTSMVPV